MSQEIGDLRHLAVAGMGRSGIAAARLLLRQLPAVAIDVVDEKAEDELGEAPAELRAAGVRVLLGEAARLPGDAELLVKSPGVPTSSPVVAAALERGLPIWSEIELAARFLTNRWIAITGTNGKTTTTELTGHILRAAGGPVEVAGNVGRALATLPGAIDPAAVVVAELSSFQLEHIARFRPDVAVLLNLTEDHIDRHGTYGRYVDAKLRIFENQTPPDLALVNGDDAGIAALVGDLPGHARRGCFSRVAAVGDAAAGGAAAGGVGVPTRDVPEGASGAPSGGLPRGVALLAGLSDRALWLRTPAGYERLCALSDLALKGDHNVENSLAAAAAAAAVGVAPPDIAAALQTFPGVAHRLQVVGMVRGVTWVNDSKATNVDAALKALTAYSGAVHLILGGSLKGASFDPLAAGTEGRVKEAILIGAAAAPLGEAFARRHAAVGERATPYVALPDLEAAVAHAAAVAAAGDVVLLSPACASFDQYRNFEHRGAHFAELVAALEESAS